MAEVKWLPEALADIERLYAFLYEKNPEAAKRIAQLILEGAELLSTSPRLGRPMDDGKRRELFIPFASGGYVLRPRQENANTVVIIRVWHSRENREI